MATKSPQVQAAYCGKNSVCTPLAVWNGWVGSMSDEEYRGTVTPGANPQRLRYDLRMEQMAKKCVGCELLSSSRKCLECDLLRCARRAERSRRSRKCLSVTLLRCKSVCCDAPSYIAQEWRLERLGTCHHAQFDCGDFVQEHNDCRDPLLDAFWAFSEAEASIDAGEFAPPIVAPGSDGCCSLA